MSNLELKGLPEGEHRQVDDLASLFINDTPMLDVRAPVEFEQGAFPNAINIPLMTDVEREAVGIKYKEQGQEAAILLGAELVTEQLQKQRKQQWADFFKKHPNAVLYCFRGGLRSQISQQWIEDETGKDYPRVSGGYKAMRRFLLDSIDRIAAKLPIVILGGRTGSGKTRVLKTLPNSIDLEGLANHRGSAFGPTATPQPTQINFENALAIALLKAEHAGHRFIVIEDEGRNVGSVGVPQSLYDAMQQSPIVKLEVSDDERNKISVQEYVLDIHQQFLEQDDNNPQLALSHLSGHLLTSLEKIQKRLGGERYKKVRKAMQQALEQYKESKSIQGFEPLVNHLLFDYYDPMYDYQISKKQHRIIFNGSQQAVIEYLKSYQIKDGQAI
jgi:tRNA 2-selenouridine synthase